MKRSFAFELIRLALLSNKGSRALIISSFPELDIPLLDLLVVNKEYFIDPILFDLNPIKIEIVRYAPSFSVLNSILKKRIGIEDLHWRHFEQLIAQLLEKDGYKIELTRGTKDGGVDVVAIKDLGIAGYFKTIWQAKKRTKDKVGLSIIRELADVTQEENASKGIIVTSSYLTKGALDRVERDRHILGKIDKNDLNEWIEKFRSGKY